MVIIYWIWMTISIFVAHYVTDIAGIENYAMKKKILGGLILFLVYMAFLILFNWLAGLV